MTNLTEQWNKGKLPEGDYYIKRRNGFLPYDNIDSCGVWRNSIDEDIIEVLAEVPSYEQWQAKLEENTKLKTENKWYSEQLNEAVKEEAQLKEILEKHKKVTAKTQIKNCDLEIINNKLKELLEECKPFIELCNYTPENKRLLEQIVEQIGDK